MCAQNFSIWPQPPVSRHLPDNNEHIIYSNLYILIFSTWNTGQSHKKTVQILSFKPITDVQILNLTQKGSIAPTIQLNHFWVKKLPCPNRCIHHQLSLYISIVRKTSYPNLTKSSLTQFPECLHQHMITFPSTPIHPVDFLILSIYLSHSPFHLFT